MSSISAWSRLSKKKVILFFGVSYLRGICCQRFNPLTAKLFNLNFHPLEVVSRWRDPQLQVSENYSDLTKWRSTVFNYCWLTSHFIFSMFLKVVLIVLIKNETRIYAAPAVKGSILKAPITTIVVFILLSWLYYHVKSLLLGMKLVLKNQNLQKYVLKWNKYV